MVIIKLDDKRLEETRELKKIIHKADVLDNIERLETQLIKENEKLDLFK